MSKPSSYRLEFVDSTLDAPIVRFVQTFEEVQQIASTGVVFKRIAQYEADESTRGIDPHGLVTDKEKSDLLKFICHGSKPSAHKATLSKQSVQRLNELGLIRHTGFGRYSITVIGKSVAERLFDST